MIKLSHISYTVANESLLSKEKKTKILNDINLEVNESERVGIVGESGAGKTTLAKILAGISSPTSGDIFYKGSSVNNLINETSVQILFQNSAELINPLRTVSDILNEVTKNNTQQVNELLNLVELSTDILSRIGKELSGGERQRVGLLRLLAVNPELLIVDEPFSAQDVESQLNLMKLLKKINADSHLTIICVSHDLQIISKFTDRLFVMRNGEIVESGSTSEVMTSPHHDYTKFLIKSKNYDIEYSDFVELQRVK
ncbi:MAG: ATP-binding cassette domain-containing protein [Bacteroidota bacterium]